MGEIMTVKHLKELFAPSSVCVIGAKNKPGHIGEIVLRNLISGGFDGPIMPVSSELTSLCGILTYPTVADLPIKPDVAIICQDDVNIETALKDIVAAEIKAVSIIGLPGENEGADLESVAEFSKKYGIRILGPNSFGTIIPGKKFNASLMHLPVKPGKIAVVSQSAALSSTLTDWAYAHGVGFSHFISLGSCPDVGFGDVIDYLGSDPFTRAILVYMESLQERRNFLSAARATARNKPVIVMKTGKHENIQHITRSHTGALAGSDSVFDAAFRRSGMLRVGSMAELFAGAETLSSIKPFSGNRLAVVSNGGGLNVLTCDHLLDQGAQLAEFSEDTTSALRSVLGPKWNGQNPIDLGLCCAPHLYGAVYEVLRKAKGVDCTLCLHAPNFKSESVAAAESLAGTYKKIKGHLITCWTGEETVKAARHLFETQGIPTYSSPRMAVMSFMHVVRYKQNQITLMETPERLQSDVKPARQKVRKIIEDALTKGETWLNEGDAKSILHAYGIDIVTPYTVQSYDEAQVTCHEIGYPVAVKIKSRDVVHKSDVGGVVLNVQNDAALKEAIDGIQARLTTFNPDASVEGFVIQKMIDKTHTRELIAGMTYDQVFGPVILFGEGGTATELIADSAVALPPLNKALAKDLVSRTKISKLLSGYRDQPAINEDALHQILVDLSELCIDCPEIQEMEINPIFSSPNGALAVDTRIRISQCAPSDCLERLAIRPYPKEYEEQFTMRNGRDVFIRPIKPEDEPAHFEFLSKISPEDIRFRFFGSVRELPHSEMARLTQLDYDREMAFVAQALVEETGEMETLGVVRTGTDPSNEEAEYAILVRSDLKGQKLGWKLLNKMIEYTRKRGTTYFVGQILRQNRTMLDMVKSMGFEAKSIPDEDIVEVRLKL